MIFYGLAICQETVSALEDRIGRVSKRIDHLRPLQAPYLNSCAALNLKLKEGKVAHKMGLPEWEPTSTSALQWPSRVVQKLELSAKGSPMARYARNELQGLKVEAQSIRLALKGAPRHAWESEASEIG